MSIVTVMLITMFVVMIGSVVVNMTQSQFVYSSSAIKSLLNLTQSQNKTEEGGQASVIVLSSTLVKRKVM